MAGSDPFIEENKEKSETVKELQEKIAAKMTKEGRVVPHGTVASEEVGEGVVSKAKEDLVRSQSKPDMKPDICLHTPEAKKSESDLHWEKLETTLDRPMRLCDMDFSDLIIV